MRTKKKGLASLAPRIYKQARFRHRRVRAFSSRSSIVPPLLFITYIHQPTFFHPFQISFASTFARRHCEFVRTCFMQNDERAQQDDLYILYRVLCANGPDRGYVASSSIHPKMQYVYYVIHMYSFEWHAANAIARAEVRREEVHITAGCQRYRLRPFPGAKQSHALLLAGCGVYRLRIICIRAPSECVGSSVSAAAAVNPLNRPTTNALNNAHRVWTILGTVVAWCVPVGRIFGCSRICIYKVPTTCSARLSDAISGSTKHHIYTLNTQNNETGPHAYSIYD